MKQKFSVFGMTCANCALGIEKTVKKLNGVNQVTVSLMAKEMTVEFDEKIISTDQIISLVKSIGYTAVIFGTEIKIKSHADKLKKRFFISLIFLLPLIYLCMGHLVGAPLPMKGIKLIAEWVLATVIISLNFAFYVNGVKAVKNKMPNMDTLISLGSSVAYIYSVVATILFFVNGYEVAHVFFEGSAMVLVLVTLGKFLEELSKKKTGDEIDKLSRLIPETALVLKDGKETLVPVKSIQKGDQIILKAGDYVPVDGVILEGVASIDNSAITGESLPVEKMQGDGLTSGSVVKNGYLIMTAEAVGEDTVFSRIIQMVKSAGASKAPVQQAVDKVSAVFVPVVSLIAILVFALWWGITGDLDRAINFAVSVLVVSCPCSLGLATPVAVMATMGKGASMGVLFKDAKAMTLLSKIDTVFLDKTATITVGKPKVTDFIVMGDYTDNKIKEIAFSLEEKSSHPLAECVKEFCEKTSLIATDFDYQIGKGVIAKIDGKKYLLGNKALIEDSVGFIRSVAIDKDKTLLYLVEEDRIIAVFGVSDTLREDSISGVDELKSQNISITMLTGDTEKVASAIAEKVGIDSFMAGVLPEDKKNAVDRARREGKIVAMVGDGINDSPALKSADVGVAVGNGTDIAIDSADVVLTGGGISSLPNAIGLSKKSQKIIKGNLFWAFIYNALAIPIAGGALSFVGVVFSPWIASVCMSLSSIFVVTNALRIRRFGKKEKSKSKSFTQVYTIEGMMCMHCKSKVEEIFKTTLGVESVEVDLDKGLAIVKTTKDISKEVISRIENANFKVKSVK